MAKDPLGSSAFWTSQGTGGEPDEEAPQSAAIPDMIRRVMALGLSGFFTTEEALRKALGDTMPRDWIDFAASQSERTRRDFAEAVAQELGRVLEQVDLGELLAQILESRSVEIHARVKLLPQSGKSEDRGSIASFELDIDEEGSS